MMKKYFNLALLSAIALTGPLFFTACSSDNIAEEQKAPDSPLYNPETGEVGIEFVMNVATGSTTRMSADATQATTANAFRGIDHAYFLTENQDADGKHIAAATTMDRIYDLSQVLAPNAITSSNSRRVLEMSLPLNTNTIMFYGKAIEGTATAAQTALGLTAYDLFGHLKSTGGYNVAQNLSDVSFEVQKRLSEDNKEKYSEIQTLLAAILTCVMNSNLDTGHRGDISGDDAPSGCDIPYVFDIADNEYNVVYWKDYVGATYSPAIGTTTPITPLEIKLGTAYKEMTTIAANAGELRCGSAAALERMLQDLWTIVNEVRCATPTSKPETVAKYLASRISVRMRKYLTATVPGDGAPVTNVQWTHASNMISELGSETAWPATAGEKPSGFSHINSSTLSVRTFPHNFNLPEGSTHLAWDGTKQAFNYVQNYNTSGMPGAGTFTVDSYYFSPELLYFGNSPIRVSNTTHKTSDYPATVTAWDADASWGEDWAKNKHVLSSTRSVAMTYDINYGTSLLETKVGYSNATLQDNNHNIQYQKNHEVDEPNKTITVTDNSFLLKGVLIGGQSKKVGWNYLPIGDTQGYVYDVAIASTAIPATGTSASNYTLVFDNYKNAETQDKVYVALELVNNTGQDFFGLHNMIRAGGTFYLIGELDVDAATNKTSITWPTNYALPPYNSDGTTITTPRVFMQDYMTSATFKLGEYSLQYAYLTVPDLRSSSLTLGLSVDINWSTGLNFSEIIVGGTTQTPTNP